MKIRWIFTAAVFGLSFWYCSYTKTIKIDAPTLKKLVPAELNLRLRLNGAL